MYNNNIPNPLDYVPQVLSPRIVIGTSFALGLRAQRRDGTAIDLTGYTVTAPFVARYGMTPLVDVPAFTVEQPTASTVIISLTGEQTTQLAPAGVPTLWGWYVWASDADEEIELARGDLLLLPP